MTTSKAKAAITTGITTGGIQSPMEKEGVGAGTLEGILTCCKSG